MIFGDMPESDYIARIQHFITEYLQKSLFVHFIKTTFEPIVQENERKFVT